MPQDKKLASEGRACRPIIRREPNKVFLALGYPISISKYFGRNVAEEQAQKSHIGYLGLGLGLCRGCFAVGILKCRKMVICTYCAYGFRKEQEWERKVLLLLLVNSLLLGTSNLD